MHFTDSELQHWQEAGAGADRERVIEHLATCADCAGRYAAAIRLRPLRAEPAADAQDFAAAGRRVGTSRPLLPSRQRWILPLAAAAILVILIAVPIARHDRDTTPDLHFRGSGVVAVAPQGAVDRNSTEFVWSSSLAAPRFRIEVGDATHVITMTEATGSRLAMPRPTRALLQPGVEYWWTVTAIDANGKALASSTRRAFTIKPD